jgi:glycosyltransferase involved in cell wall biosynthesis
MNNKIKILYLVLEMDLGGLQRVLHLLIRNIDKDKFVPYLVCLEKGGIFLDMLNDNINDTYILSKKPGPFDLKAFLSLLEIIKENKIDIIHSQNGTSFYAAMAKIFSNIKSVIHTDHGRLIPDSKSAILEDRYSSYFFKKFVCVSNELTNYLNTNVKVKKNKLMTILNGIDTDQFRPVHKDERLFLRNKYNYIKELLIFGTVCRLDPIKNLKFLIRNFAIIHKTLPESILVITGEGPIKEELIDYCQTIGLEREIIFLGQLDSLEKVYPIFNIYLNASLSEGTSMTILEAMSCGLPVIASNVGGTSKLVDNNTGILFQSNNNEEFIESVIYLAKRPQLAVKMGIRGREKVEQNFSINKCVQRYESLYNFYAEN